MPWIKRGFLKWELHASWNVDLGGEKGQATVEVRYVDHMNKKLVIAVDGNIICNQLGDLYEANSGEVLASFYYSSHVFEVTFSDPSNYYDDNQDLLLTAYEITVAEILASLDLNKHIGSFVSEGIVTDDELCLLQESHLKELGLTIGERSRLLQFIKNYSEFKSGPSSTSPNQSNLAGRFAESAASGAGGAAGRAAFQLIWEYLQSP
jgi:hypothetical protein